MSPPLRNQRNPIIAFNYVTRGISEKNIHARVIVLVPDTLSHCAIEVYEVSTK